MATLLERFIASYDASIRTRMEALIDTIQTNHSFTDLEQFLTLSQADVAGDIEGLSASNGFITGFTSELQTKTTSLLSTCNPKDNIEERFYSLFGNNLSAGLADLVDVLTEKAIINSFKDIPNVSAASIENTMVGLSCEAPLTQGFASNLLSDVGTFLNDVTRQVTFTGAAHPENNVYVPLYVKCFDEDNSSALIGEQTTTSNGVFQFSYSETIPEAGGYTPKDLKFEVYTDSNALSPFATVYKTFDPATESSFTLNISNPPAPADTSPDVSDLTTVGVTFPSGFLTYLSGKGVTTLQDVRDKGGIYHFDDLPVGSATAVAAVDNYASLNLLTDDLTVCQTIYDAGYNNIPVIANSPRATFIAAVNDAVTNPIDTVPAGKLYSAAQGIMGIQNNLVAGAQAAKANGNATPFLDGVSGAKTIKDILKTDCNCDDCESGVSPLAYLSSLLKYITDNVYDGNTPLTLSFLENNFYQPFGKLSTDCEAVDKKVCQIRICIDVLKKYYEVNSSSIPANAKALFRQSAKEYLINLYNSILNRIGTSYEELKDVPETGKDALANRLGIDKTKLPDLVLDIVNADVSTNDDDLGIYEDALERIFGTPNSWRNPLQQGYYYPSSYHIVTWDISGAKWIYNTDINGYIHLEIVEHPTDPDIWNVYLHKSATFSTNSRIAFGTVKAASINETVNFTPLNNSGIFATFIFGLMDNVEVTFKFSLFPEYVAWKLQKTNSEWQAEDNQLDNIFTNIDSTGTDPSKRHKYPYIDPDLISLDDVRNPFDTTADTPSELWTKRRNWIDDILEILYTDQLFESGTGPKYDTVYTYLKGNNFSYDGSTSANIWSGPSDPSATFPAWYSILANPGSGDYETTKATVYTNLKLEVPEFLRLYELQLLLSKLGTSNTEYSLTDEQRSNAKEFIDITIVSCKRKYLDAWIDEEQTNNIWLNQQQFYKALTQPKVGTWPQIIQPFKTGGPAVPFIEPGYISLADMVDAKMLYHEYSSTPELESVYNAYTDRKNKLLTDLVNIKAYREAQDKIDPETNGLAFGFEQLIATADTGTGTTLFNYTPDYTGNSSGTFETRFLKLYRDINEGNTTEKADAIENMQEMPNIPTTNGGLAMTIPEFNELFGYYQTCLEQGLTDAQWQAVYELMQRGLKRKYYYSDWNTEEANWVTTPSTIALKYWQVQKQKLVKWRANEETRKTWESFLERTALPPVLDSDYIYYSNFIDPRDSNGDPISPAAYSNPPFTLWKNRAGYIQTVRDEIISYDDILDLIPAYFKDPKEGYTFIDVYNDYIDKGIDITQYLNQWNITYIGFITLAKAYIGAATMTSADWENVYNITVDVAKKNNTNTNPFNASYFWSTMQRAEAIDGIYISPQIFALPPDTSLSFNLAVQADNQWLVNPQLKKEWQQKLTARVDFQNALIKNHRDLIEDIEDDNLIQLRDALVVSISKPQFDQLINAQWITDNLLIDAKTNCCSATTRVAQAVETLQVFLFSLRNGLLEDNYPTLEIMNDYFDDHWQWLGSYESWRSLMFTYLYPENLLDPAYRQYQTGKFREITDAIISNSRFSPAMADDAAKQYQAYFEDITSLTPAASVSTKVIDKGAKFRVYIFARGGKTGNLYYTSYDLINANGEITNVATWEPVPGMADTTRVAGATIFQVSTGEPYIYVMANLRLDKPTTVRFNRFSLSKLSWDAESTEIDADKKFDASTAVLESTFDSKQIPYVAMKLAEADTKRLFVFQFNKEGKAFSDNIRAIGAWVGKTHALIRVQAESNIEYTYCINDYKGNEGRTDGRTFDFQLTTGMFKSNPDKREDGEYWYAEKQFKPAFTLKLTDKYFGAIYQREVNRIHMYLNSTGGPAYIITNLFDSGNAPLNTNYSGVGGVDSSDINLSFIGPVNPTQLSENTVGNNETFSIVSYGGIGGRLIRKGTITLSTATTPVNNKANFVNEILKPISDIAITLDRKDNSEELQRRRFNTYKNLAINKDAHQTQWVYLQEYYYFMPMLLAIQLQKNKFYTEALDWYRQVFDYSAPLGKRKIYYGLTLEELTLSGNLLNGNIYSWLTGPTDPHQIASLRPNNYTRFTVYSIVQCLLDFADTEYTRDTSESVPRARTLYSFALELLQTEVYNNQAISASELIDGLDWLITETTVWDTWLRIKNLLRQIDDYDTLYGLVNTSSGTITGVINDLAMPEWEAKIERIVYLIETALKLNSPKVPVSKQIEYTGEELIRMHLAAAATPALKGYDATAFTVSESDFTVAYGSTTGENFVITLENPNSLKNKYEVNFSFDQLDFTPVVTLDLYGEEFNQWQKSPNSGMLQNQKVKPAYLPLFNNYYCVVPNPIPDYMRMHAEIQLLKIRNCMNISGLKRELDPYAAPIDSTSGIPSMIGGGRLNVSSTIPRSATIYRYQFLVERAKQLVSYAQQMEGSLLSALEKRDAEYYTLMKARQDLNISRANVTLSDLRLKEAESGVKLAQMQKDRSQLQVDGLQGMINAGLNKFEKRIVDSHIALSAIQLLLVNTRQVSDNLKNSILGAGLSALSSGATIGINAAATTARIIQATLEASTIGLKTTIDISSIYSSQARREQEWNFQKTLAEQDIKIGNQQIKIAEDRVRIVGQEKRISEMQSSYAEDTVNFLSSKFTNVQLYEWMVRMLQRTYDYMLQQATSVAKTAQLQLAFERQESPTGIIQDDYWEAPADGSGNAGSTDRRGLTGSTRLLADIVKLESYAIETNRRKLQLTKTISLATYFPIEFQQFRQTGQFNFQTTLQHFDRDFPGHYLRLIRSVRMSVIALTPPNEGIKATLANTGTSTVIIKANNAFVPVRSRKDPDSVALTSPYNASGMFEMQQQDPNIYLPFEGTGVETSWYFEMLKANNPFDFSTIADVVLTIDYTALEDYNYKIQKWNEANRNKNNADGSRLFSMRSDFADQWYDLSNGLLSVTFDISRLNFPANTTILQGGNAKVYVSFGEYVEDKKASEKPQPNQIIQKLNGVSLNLETKGVLTEQNIENQAGELPQITGPYLEEPFGQWKFEVKDPDLSAKIKYGVIQDIIIVIDYKAQTTKYPQIG